VCPSALSWAAYEPARRSRGVELAGSLAVIGHAARPVLLWTPAQWLAEFDRAARCIGAFTSQVDALVALVRRQERSSGPDFAANRTDGSHKWDVAPAADMCTYEVPRMLSHLLAPPARIAR